MKIIRKPGKVLPNLFCGENRRDKEEGKKSSNKAELGDKAPTRNALALSLALSLSLSVCVLLFSKQTSLSSTSLLLFRVGETNGALSHNNKEEAKKLEHFKAEA